MTRHAIRLADAERPCHRARCQTLTRYRACYVYENDKGSVLIPYCRVHLIRFAATHEVPMPREAR